MPLTRGIWASAAAVALLTGGYWYLAAYDVAPLAAVLAAVAVFIILSRWRLARMIAAWVAMTLGSIGLLVSITFPQPPILLSLAALGSVATWVMAGRDVAAGARSRKRYVFLYLALSLVTVLALRGVWNVMGSEGGDCDFDIRCYFP